MSKYLFTIASMFFLFMLGACSDDGHSTTKPIDTALSSSFTLDDLDELLRDESSSSKTDDDAVSSSSAKSDKTTSSSAGKAQSSSSGKTTAKSSSSKKTSKSSSSVKTSVSGEYSECDKNNMDKNGLKALDIVNQKAVDLFEAIADENMDELEELSAEVKPMYKRILDKYPNSCGAKVGYAVTSVVDFVNNDVLRSLSSDYEKWFNREIHSVDDFIEMAEDLANGDKTFTQNAQNVLLTEVLPVVDSSIGFLQYVLAQDDYTLRINNGGCVRELDKSEFGLVLGGLFATKALVNVVTSINLELTDANGKYDWMNTVYDFVQDHEGYKLNKKQTAAVDVLEKLIGKKGSFTSIYKDRRAAWRVVPELVDSALSEFKAALQYSLNERSQEDDVFVVGKGSDADVSRSDVEEFIENIEEALAYVHGPRTFDVEGVELTFDPRKYFENYEGIETFLPYYVFTDKADLNSICFTDAKGNKTACMKDFVEEYELPKDARGRIIFPDPTFGGIFPKFSKEYTIWDFLVKIDASL